MLLRGGCVLSLDKRVGNFTHADVRVEDGRVAEVGVGLRARNVEVVDATDTIVMPGFVDAHRHAWKSLFRHHAAAADAAEWARRAARLEPDDVYAATLLSLLTAASAGVTTIVDWCDVAADGGHIEAALQAHDDAGLRTVFVHGTVLSGTDGNPLAQRRSAAAADTDVRTNVAFAAADLTGSDWARARELGLRIHAHAGADPADRGAVAALAARDLLGPDVTLVHGAQLGDDDLDALAATGTGLVLTPASGMVAGLGPPPMQRLIDRDIRPGLGVDDDVQTPGELFAQMRSAQSLQHADVFERKLAGKGSVPALLGTRDVIRYATTDGAQAAGLDDRIGTLTPGKQADIVLLRTDRPNIAPVNDPIGAVVWGMDVSNVDTVLVGGRIVVRDGVLDTDRNRVRDLVAAAHRRLAAAPPLETVEGGSR